MKKRSNNIPQFVRAYRILQYLQQHTDADHPTTQAEMRNADGQKMHKTNMKKYMGSRETSNSLIHFLAEALNCDVDESLLPEDEWQIVFDDYTKRYGKKSDVDTEDDESEYVILPNGKKQRKATPICNLYYQSPFSHEEIDALIEGVWFSKTLRNEKREQIVKKIKKHLTNKYYKDRYQGVQGIKEPIIGDRILLEENLDIIREAIGKNKKLTFQFNGYDRRRNLIHVGDWRRVVSPYYITAYNGHYYLIGGWDSKWGKDPKMCIYRIDLMTELEILPDKRLPKREVVGLPYEWNEEFALSHLNMFHDNPEHIKLKITCEPHQWTFLYDWFGDKFTSVSTKDGDFVTVYCSPQAMVYWALYYCDRVEVLSPEHVRKEVQKKIKELSEKYKDSDNEAQGKVYKGDL